MHAVAGPFVTAGNVPAPYSAVWDGSTRTWSSLDVGLGTLNAAATVVIGGVNAGVLFGGSFTGPKTAGIAQWEPPELEGWNSVGGGIAGSAYVTRQLRSKLLVVGGFFGSAGAGTSCAACRYIAVFDSEAHTWHACGSGLDWNAMALTITADDMVLAGGAFQSLPFLASCGVVVGESW